MGPSFLHIDIAEIIKTIGYVGLFLVIFAESGLFFGFFLPGGSLLFTAGLLASQGYFDISILIVTLGAAAILGDSTGYWFGKKVGPKIFSREDSRFFNKKHLKTTHDFYDKYGSRTIIVGRFVPIVRTFAPILAGVGEMPYGVFLRYNVIGAVAWAIGISFLGYFLGTRVPGIERYLLLIIVAIIVASVIPIVVEYAKARRMGA